MSKPKIGITTRRLRDLYREVDAVDVVYGDAVVRAGGLPMLLTAAPSALAREVLRAIDGLLLTGGGDVDPCFYHQERSTKVGGIDRDRDAWELELTTEALDAALPVLGVCRGCQVLNVAKGGSLIQHLPDVTPLEHLILEPRDRISHVVSARTGSRLAEVVGSEELGVNTIHHQSVDALGVGLRVGACSSDGVVESIELEDGPALGVQWHPEDLLADVRHQQLFNWLVDEGRAAARCRPDPNLSPDEPRDHDV